MRFGPYTNYDGSLITNTTILLRAVGDPGIDAAGNVTSAIGLPTRIFLGADGMFTNTCQAQNYFVTNALGAVAYFNKGYLFRAPFDTGPQIYSTTAPGILMTGMNYFITLNAGTNGGGSVTFNQVTNALGYTPAPLAATNGYIKLLEATNVANAFVLSSSNNLYSDYTTKIAVVSALITTASNNIYSDYTMRIAALAALSITNLFPTNAAGVTYANGRGYISTNYDALGLAGTIGGNFTNQLNVASNALQSQIVSGSVTASTVTNIAAFQAKIATNGITSLAYTNPAAVLYTNSLPGLTNGLAATNGPTIFNPNFPTGVDWAQINSDTNGLNPNHPFKVVRKSDPSQQSLFDFGQFTVQTTNANFPSVPDVAMIGAGPVIDAQGDKAWFSVFPSFGGSGFTTTITSSNGFTGAGPLRVANVATVATVVVTNGATNLSLTASTVIAADANKKIVSLPNIAGSLTNDGAGNIGFTPMPNFPQVTNIAAVNATSNGLFALLATKAPTNAPVVWNTTNYNALVTTNIQATTNGFGHDDLHISTSRGGDLDFSADNNFQAQFVNLLSLFDNAFADTFQMGNGTLVLSADGNDATNGQIQLQAPGGVRLINGGLTSTFLYNASLPPASGHTNVLVEIPGGQVTNVDMAKFVFGSLFTQGITNLFGTNAPVASVANQVALVPTNWDFRGGSNFNFSYASAATNALAAQNLGTTNFLQAEKMNSTNGFSISQTASNLNTEGDVSFGITGLATNIIGSSTNFIKFINSGMPGLTNGSFIWNAAFNGYSNWLTGVLYTNNGSGWIVVTNSVTLYSVAGASPAQQLNTLAGPTPAPLVVWSGAFDHNGFTDIGFLSGTNICQMFSNILKAALTNSVINSGGFGTNEFLTNSLFANSIIFSTTTQSNIFNTAAFGASNVDLALYSGIFGGLSNSIGAGAQFSGIFGGASNSITGGSLAWDTQVIGGEMNTVGASRGVIMLVGLSNRVDDASEWSQMIGGISNQIHSSSINLRANGSAIINSEHSQVVNTNIDNLSGGFLWHSMIIGGWSNYVSAPFSYVFGRNVTNTYSGNFAWSDGPSLTTPTNSEFAISGTNGIYLVGPLTIAGSAMTNAGIYFRSNQFNLFGVTNGMANFSYWQGSSNGILTVLFYSNGVPYQKALWP